MKLAELLRQRVFCLKADPYRISILNTISLPMPPSLIKLIVLEPTKIVIDEQVEKVTAVAENGSFCLLPQHVDFLAALAPGLLSFERPGGEEVFLAVDEGMLVKRADEVLVSTTRAVRGGALGELRRVIREQFQTLDDRQRSCRTAIAKLESDVLRRMMELQE